jgi:catechol 2,3-dioxygenase-like lactoylglutathione lyase family enzyme
MLKLRGILETAIYVGDLDAAQDFYGRVLGLSVIGRDRDRHVFFRCGDGVFLVFNPRITANEPASVNGASVPPHGAIGAGHMAFRAREDELPDWRARLELAQVTIESEIAWPRGGRSIYFRDPAGNSIELASPKLWGLAEDAAGD